MTSRESLDIYDQLPEKAVNARKDMAREFSIIKRISSSAVTLIPWDALRHFYERFTISEICEG